MQPIRGLPRRVIRRCLALDRNPVGAVVRRAGDRVIAPQLADSGQVECEAEILAGLVADHWAAISGDKDERADDAALVPNAFDHEVAPSIPAARLRGKVAI